MQLLHLLAQIGQSEIFYHEYIKRVVIATLKSDSSSWWYVQSFLNHQVNKTFLHQITATGDEFGSFKSYTANTIEQLKKAPWIVYFHNVRFLDSVNTWQGTLNVVRNWWYNHLLWSSIGHFRDTNAAQLWQALFLGKTDPASQVYLLFKHSGILHALAVSGSNLTMLYDQVKVVLNRFSRTQQFFIWCFCVGSYTFLVGDQPSLVRAAVMSLWVALGQVMGRRVTFSWALIWSVLVIVVLLPSYKDSLGFQLSVVAVIGVCMVQSVMAPLTQLVHFFGVPNVQFESPEQSLLSWTGLWSTLLSTLLIQGWVAPLILMNFGEMSLRGVVISPLLVIVIPLLMKLVYWLALAFLTVSTPLLTTLGLPLLELLSSGYFLVSSFLLAVLSAFDAYTPQLMVRYQLSPVEAVVWYVLLGGGWWWAFHKERQRQKTRYQLRATELCL